MPENEELGLAAAPAETPSQDHATAGESPFGDEAGPFIEGMGDDPLNAQEAEPEAEPQGDELDDDPRIQAKIKDLERGYQQKFTSLADERKELEQDANVARQLREELKDPAKRRELANWLATMDGQPPIGQPSQPSAQTGLPANWNDWVDNEKTLYLENQATRRELADTKALLAEVKDHLRSSSQRDARSVAARETATALSAEYGQTVTPDQVLEAMIASKIENPEAAWLYMNKDAIKASIGRPAPVGKKPNTPGTRGKSFDPKGMSQDEMFARLNRGETAIASP